MARASRLASCFLFRRPLLVACLEGFSAHRLLLLPPPREFEFGVWISHRPSALVSADEFHLNDSSNPSFA